MYTTVQGDGLADSGEELPGSVQVREVERARDARVAPRTEVPDELDGAGGQRDVGAEAAHRSGPHHGNGEARHRCGLH